MKVEIKVEVPATASVWNATTERTDCRGRRCSFFVIIRVFDKYFKTKVDAKSIEGAEQIIEKTIAGFEYQIMNIYKANE